MKLFLFTIIVSFVLIISCKQNNSMQKVKTTVAETKDTIMSIKVDTLSSDSVSILLNRLKRFAEDYNPKKDSKKEIPFLKNSPENITYAFKRLRTHGNKEYIKYLTLILVKVYKEHLKCCHQGYELRNNTYTIGIDSISDPMLFEFNLISKTFDNSKPIEFINSAIGFSWLEKNQQLLNYGKLKKEFEEIEKINADILKDPNSYY